MTVQAPVSADTVERMAVAMFESLHSNDRAHRHIFVLRQQTWSDLPENCRETWRRKALKWLEAQQ